MDAASARRFLEVVRTALVPRKKLEEELLAFDADEDLAAIIPMPSTIPAPIRGAITRAVGSRFEFASDLDAWLCAPHEALGGDAPLNRIIYGDGLAVLRALGVEVENQLSPEVIAAATKQRSLRIVR
jgi:hypothetical protein